MRRRRGLGGQLILAAARLGVRRFTLVDGDTVEAHNLNRQAFYFEDIGQPKAEALKRHILRINPEAEVEAVVANLDQHNAAQLVGQADIIFDTIDFSTWTPSCNCTPRRNASPSRSSPPCRPATAPA